MPEPTYPLPVVPPNAAVLPPDGDDDAVLAPEVSEPPEASEEDVREAGAVAAAIDDPANDEAFERLRKSED